jgi:hypothetical protein
VAALEIKFLKNNSNSINFENLGLVRNISTCDVNSFSFNFSKIEKQQKTGNWHCGVSLIG